MYGSLNILWDCLSLGLEWKLTFSSLWLLLSFPNLLTLSSALEQSHLLGFEIAQLEFHLLHWLCSFCYYDEITLNNVYVEPSLCSRSKFHLIKMNNLVFYCFGGFLFFVFFFFSIFWGFLFQFNLVSVVSDSVWPHEPQHSRPPCPSPTPGVYPNSGPLSWWCHPTISSSAIPFFIHLQSFPASGYFLVSQCFASGGQSIGVSASASVLPVNTRSDLL